MFVCGGEYWDDGDSGIGKTLGWERRKDVKVARGLDLYGILVG